MRLIGSIAIVVAAAVTGCVPQAHLEARGVTTNIEKTTVTVKDPQGNVLRVEEKEMVLQQYTARNAVELKTTKPPAVQRFRIENGKLVEILQ